MKVDSVSIRATVDWFDNRKGFGFLLGSDGFRYFVHWSAIIPESDVRAEPHPENPDKPYLTLRAQQEVTIHQWRDDPKGRRAESVEKLP
tara:strand:+ start:6380 stop:6646 length:267 start_codon:yes stop_codon:yes gene_type:complete